MGDNEIEGLACMHKRDSAWVLPLGLVQLDRGIWFLLMVMAIAPLGLALDQEQKLAPSTDAALQLLTNGDLQSDVPSGLPSSSDNSLESTPIPLIQVSMKHSQSFMDTLFENITYASYDIENPGGEIRREHHSSRDGQNLDLISQYASYAQNVRIANTDFRSKIETNMSYIYSAPSKEDALETRPNDLQRAVSSNLNNIYAEGDSGDIIWIANQGAVAGGLTSSYYYEGKTNQEEILPISNANNDNLNSKLEYIYKNEKVLPQNGNAAIVAETIMPGPVPSRNVLFPGPVTEIVPNLKYLREASSMETAPPQVPSVPDIEAGTNSNIDRLIRDNADEVILPDLVAPGQGKHLDGKARHLKNYAIIVGINNYTDRSSLHTSVNDAETMSALMESYGYSVIKLTDKTPIKPTKSNILEKALGEMKYKTDLGKVLIYFSGHGENNGDKYYLIPQDSNGQTTSYISSEELQKSIHGLKNVALVVDACNSGGLENVVDKGQVILASSEKDQPSNEIWSGSLSLFTDNLCKAIKEEEKLSKKVILERCFYKAREATERWSCWPLLAQTPQIEDKTETLFSLN